MMKVNLKSFIAGFIVAVVFLIGSVSFAASTSQNISAILNSIKITVNGKAVKSDTILYKGTPYASIKTISAALGKDITWDAKTSTAKITDKKVVEDTKPKVNKSISAPTTLKYGINSADGVTLNFFAKNISGKAIKYYTLKISTYNAVGDPSYDNINDKCVFYQKYVGPVEADGTIAMFNLFTYQTALEKVVIDEIAIEYMDGTKETVAYGYSTNDSSGYNAD